MFSPLSLRLWCMAAMAPALTEAAAQPRSFKLPPTPENTEHEGAQASSLDSPDSGHPTSVLNQQSLVGCRDLIQVSNQNGNSNNYLHTTTSPRVTSRALCANFDPQKIRKNLMGEAFKSSIQLMNGDAINHHTNTMNNNSSKTQIGTPGSLKCNNVSLSPSLSTTTTMSPQTPTTVSDTGPLASPSPSGTDNEAEDRSDDLQTQAHLVRSVITDDLIEDLTTGIEPENDSYPNKNHNNNQMEQLDEVVISGKTTDSLSKQQELSKRAMRLLRRLRRLQYKQLDNHSHQQMGGLVEHENQEILAARELAATGNNTDAVDATSSSKLDPTKTNTPTLLGLVQQAEKDNTALPNSSLSRKMLNRTNGNHSSSHSKRFRRAVRDTSNLMKAGVKHLQSCIDSDATESSSGESCDEEDVVASDNKGHAHIPVHKRALWKWAVDRAAVASRWTWLQAQVSDLEYRIRQQTDIYRQIRATKGVVSLGEQSPPEDLMKLRTSRLGRKLSPIEAKIAKLESRNDMSPSNLSTLISNMDRQTAKLNQSLQNFCSPPPKGLTRSPMPTLTNTPLIGKLPAQKPMNGYVDNTHGNTLTNDALSGESGELANKRIKLEPSKVTPASPPDSSCTAARTRPIRVFRKRKLLHTAGIQHMSKKAQKLSTVRCGCCSPIMPCVMCGGRYNTLQSVDPDVMPLSERVAILDFSYHPVLSFPQEVPLSLHFEGLLKSGEWQNRQTSKSPLKKKPHLSHSQQVRRASQKLAKNAAAALLSTAKMRSNRVDAKVLSRSHSHPSSAPNTPKNSSVDANRLCRTDVKKRRAAQLAMKPLVALKKNRNRTLSLPSTLHHKKSSISAPTTPNSGASSSTAATKENIPAGLSASMPGSVLQAYMRKRRGESAFDINNIVIPYSMAASTRVEKLNYKEIPTPGWRIVDQYDPVKNKLLNNVKVEKEDDDDEELQEKEDLSDELFVERHAICEVAERRRYLGFVQNNKRGRSRANSGSGTPEPWSPDGSQTENSVASQPPNRASATPSPLNMPTDSKQNLEMLQRRGLSDKVSSLVKLEKSSSLAKSERSSSLGKSEKSSPLEKSQSTKSLEELGLEEILIEVNPWENRDFPLSEQEVAAMEGSSPPPSPKQSTVTKKEPNPTIDTPKLITNTTEFEKMSRTATPDDFENEVSSEEDNDDPNDPEWTVIAPDKGNGPKPTIVLKLAKR
ncbi:KAT8 regulatory NSL complex subunit 1-like isoform X1 [Glandiceps talaboti]